MYTRKRMEADLKKIEEQRHNVRQLLVGGQIDGFKFNDEMATLDKAEVRCKGRLFHTAQELQARDEERKRNNRR